MNYNDNPEVTATQTARILSYMLEGHTITSLEAYDKFGATRLSAIIFNIGKKLGYPPKRERITVKNRFGQDVRVMKYWI